jgi:hypothetical protein
MLFKMFLTLINEHQGQSDMHYYKELTFKICMILYDCLCGLVVRVSGYRFRGPRFSSWHCQIFREVVVWNGVH